MRLAKTLVIGVLASAALACSGGITIPSIPGIPSVPPINLPSGGLPTSAPGSASCSLVTAAEVQSIFSIGTTDTSDSALDCAFLFSNFTSLSVSTDTDTDLQVAHVLLGESATDFTVAGLPAVSGVFVGQPAVYVQKGANQLQVLGILIGSDDAAIAKLVQVATLAVSRMPG